MKILIVDDEKLARERLIGLLHDLDEAHECVEAGNGLEALERVNQSIPDLVLLDIRMPVMDGLEAAQHLGELPEPPAIVFTTAYQDHALEAFESNAIDYLLKPIRLDRLQKALEKAQVINQARIAAVRASETLPNRRTHFSSSVASGIQLCPVDQIQYLKADQKYVNAIWPEGEMLLTESLKSLEDEFPDIFIRIHRNTLVALKAIAGLDKDTDGHWFVTLPDQTRLPISRRHLSPVKKAIKQQA